MPRLSLVLALCALAACGGPDAPRAPEPGSAAPASTVPADTAAHRWRTNPPNGATLRTEGGETVIETATHTVLWREGSAPLAPPYTVSATLTKEAGRLHEGYGLIFGAAGLDRPEAEQAYSYFLVRGDGSFLVKRRAGAETPVVRDWTRHPSVARDAGSAGRPNELTVRVAADSVRFEVNGSEVAVVPASVLSLSGAAGVRVSHELVLRVAGFRAGEAP